MKLFSLFLQKIINLKKYLIKKKYKFYEGSQENVLLRYLKTAKNYASIVTRVTGDCPFVDPKLVDKAIELFEKIELIMFQTH